MRRLTLEAILKDVERLVPFDYSSVAALLNDLLRAGEHMAAAFGSLDISAEKKATLREERERYRRYVEHLSALPDKELARVPPLPERRLLQREEAHMLWRRLVDRWGISGQEGITLRQWYPLVAVPLDAADSLLAVEEEPFWDAIEPLALRALLAERGITTVYELRDWGAEYTLDLRLWEPVCYGADSYWTGEDMDWLLYGSSEETVTVAGEWFVQAVKQIWPEWVRHRRKRLPRPRRHRSG